MRLRMILVLLLLMLSASAMVFSQTASIPTSEISFDIEGEIGRALPRRLAYDPQQERLAIVDAYNGLSLSDARTYRTQDYLHLTSSVIDFAFSHDGQYLAVINDLTVELWNAETSQLAASLPNPGNPRRLLGPITFSRDDAVLVFYGEYPAPPDRRRSENDTIRYPWVWHLPMALGEVTSTLPGAVEAIQMFDFPNGFVLTPEDTIVSALPSRLRILDAHSLQPLYEIPTNRYETDPLTIWSSLTSDLTYVQSARSNTLLQLETRTQSQIDIPLGLNAGSAPGALGLDVLATFRADSPLGRELLRGYRSSNWSSNAEVSIIDFVQSPGSVSPLQALVYVGNNFARNGYLLTSGSVEQMALRPDHEAILVRVRERDEVVRAYRLEDGEQLYQYLPSLRGVGRYSAAAQNRILAFDRNGQTFLSDFQRLSADTYEILADDLRYSFQFDRFFFGREPGTIVTISGTEWRVWDIPTNQVLRREIITLGGSIRATSPDGYRLLAETGSGFQIQDFDANIWYSISDRNYDGLNISQRFINPAWTRMLVVYNNSQTGQYHPGNAVAAFDQNNNVMWFAAGDDLPPVNGRSYGWVDDDTAYVLGYGRSGDAPARVYGAEYNESGLPACLVDAYPDQIDVMRTLWEKLHLYLRPDRLNLLTVSLCADVPDNFAAVEVALNFTPTPALPSATGEAVGEVPACLLQRYPGEIDAYSAIWRESIIDLSPEQAQELAVLLCEGIGVIPELSDLDPAFGVTMFIESDGTRTSGSYPVPRNAPNPVAPLAPLFAEVFERPLGSAILNSTRDLMAVSNLPGELTIYRLGFSYEQALIPITQTAQVIATQQNLIYPLPSPSPTSNMIGTLRPTLTPTVGQTLVPRPQHDLSASSESVCPLGNTLRSLDDLPVSYAATGRIYVSIGDLPVWAVEPEDGRRFQDEGAPLCGFGLNCQFSPDNAWILAQTYELVYVTRPDNSDQRVLWDLRTPNPPTPYPQNLRWSGRDTLEWDANVILPGSERSERGIVRDVLNVFPDPDPWVPRVRINDIDANVVGRQPGGYWTVVSIPYRHGEGYGSKYYLYHIQTGEYVLFAQEPRSNVSFHWSPFGDRLYFTFNDYNRSDPYEIVFSEMIARQARIASGGGAQRSPDGQLIFDTSGGRLNVREVATGNIRHYCVPGDLMKMLWSPDSNYLAVMSRLRQDEEEHLIVVDVETGEMVDLMEGVYDLITWGQDPGTYDPGAVVTPTPFPTINTTLQGVG